MFRWGILSTAKIGLDHVIPALADSENGTVAAIASRDSGRSRAVADRFGAPHPFGSYDEMLTSGTVDGVYIPLPTSQHVEWAIKSADAGLHVLVEKPLALKASDIQPVIDARDRNKVLISEAFMVTYHPQWIKVRDLIASGAIGTLKHVQGAFSYFNTDPANMRNQVSLGGGGLPDIGVYPTVSTRFATGMEPKRVHAIVDFDPTFGTDRFANVTADFGDFLMTFYCSTQMALRQEMVFHGDKGVITVHSPFNAGEYGDHVVTVWDQTHSHADTYRFAGTRQYKLEAEAFVEAANGGSTPVFSLESSVANQKVIDAIFASNEAGNWVDV